ncbi:FLYWCH-type domain-containing protein [Aphis craccivora]|uniref:FLYWCH-type domain-containing protein n=1 Tax=Aphis craccivora TaxID=307492 RepID=A0A6G0ZBY5_APHCR|nr:FLYWCH-type domain-containing protein [Aphis craccivora]
MFGSRIELITSERGKELASVNLYKHRFLDYRKKDGTLKWRCSTNKNCTAIIFSTQILRENCKRKAKESISCRPVKIIRTELLKTQLAIKCLDITSVRKAMYDKRQKKMSTLPKSLNEALCYY